MKKYLAYYENEWPANIAELTAVENKPFVGYLKGEEVKFTVIPEEPTSAYQMVDLGLPSGLKWADRNVGATSPEENGLYFSWGNVDGHAVDESGNVEGGYSFNANTYATTSGGQFRGSTLDAEHDAATVNMGSEWRIPTSAETLELVQETTQTVDTENGGMIFTSKTNGNSIFFPFAGTCGGSLLQDEGLSGDVWSSSVYNVNAEYARSLKFHSNLYVEGDSRSYLRRRGLSVRGVHA